MQSTAVVEPMDVAGNCQVSLFLCGVDRVGFLSLQCSEETLSYGVIPAVSSPTHALREALLGQSETKPAARVLGGFNRSSQHWIVVQTSDTHSVFRQVFSSRVFFEV